MRISYLLCVVSVICALITRVLAAVGASAMFFSSRALPIGYHSFVDGVLIFFMLTVASAGVAFIEKRPQ
jgi:hypothetical protein